MLTKFVFVVSVCLLVYNFRYFISILEGVKSFIGIYDFTSNMFYHENITKSLMSTCINNECTTTTFTKHPSWAIEFYQTYLKESFAKSSRNLILLSHIFSNSVSLVLMMIQPFLIKNNYRKLHKFFGYASVTLLFTGVSSSSYLASLHNGVEAYGGIYSSLGFYNMALTCAIPALFGLYYILNGNVKLHQKWMLRFVVNF
jgi:hypothetical protein